MQSLSCSKQRSLSMLQMMRTIVQEEGALRPWKGMSAMALGAGPAHAMYFSCLEIGKEKAETLGLSNKFGFLVDGELKFNISVRAVFIEKLFVYNLTVSEIRIISSNDCITGVSAIFATVCHDAVMTPAEGKIFVNEFYMSIMLKINKTFIPNFILY